MARETVAQRNARRAQEEADRAEACRLAYPLRLMNLLERACNLNCFDLSVRNGVFHLVDRDSRYDSEYELSYEWSTSNQTYLENLSYAVERAEEELKEARRLCEVKKEAQRKVNEMLTEEEREVLGL